MHPMRFARFALIAAFAAACGGAETRPAETSADSPRAASATPSGASLPPFVAAMDSAMRVLKPDLTEIHLLGVLPRWGREDDEAFVALISVHGPHLGFTSVAAMGEVFALWTVDPTLTRPLRLLGHFGSPRIKDFDVWMTEARADSVIICGRGATYGDGAMRRAFVISAREASTLVETDTSTTHPDDGETFESEGGLSEGRGCPKSFAAGGP